MLIEKIKVAWKSWHNAREFWTIMKLFISLGLVILSWSELIRFGTISCLLLKNEDIKWKSHYLKAPASLSARPSSQKMLSQKRKTETCCKSGNRLPF